MAAKKKAVKPARKAAKKAVRKTKRAAAPRKTARLWLMFPQRLITKPVVWELSEIPGRHQRPPSQCHR